MVKGPDKIMAWLLTEKGVVDGIVGNTRADCNDSLWEVSLSSQVPLALQRTVNQEVLMFSVKDENAAISMHGHTVHAYHIETGEVLKPAKAYHHLESQWYHFDSQRENGCNQYHHDLCKHQGALDSEWQISQTSLQKGWVKDPEGKHRLWLPPDWRSTGSDAAWLDKVTTLQLRNSSELLVVKF